MKNLLLIFCICNKVLWGQTFTDFSKQKNDLDKKLMLTLTSWSAANVLTSGIGWATTEKGEANYFHQMNVIWGAINIGLALPGYFKAKNAIPNTTLSANLRQQMQTEQVFLFNTGLDIAYVTAGFLLKSEGKHKANKQAQFNGFGNGLLLQGGFLFLFDLSAYLIHHRHGAELNPMIDRLSINPSGFGLQWRIGK